jgi:hypothetical protein
MKTIIAILFFAVTALNTSVCFAKQSSVAPAAAVTESRKSIAAKEANQLTGRLKEIRNLSKRNLTAGEKANLREEVLTIEQKLNVAASDGVYISVGALILIIILLIILL